MKVGTRHLFSYLWSKGGFFDKIRSKLPKFLLGKSLGGQLKHSETENNFSTQDLFEKPLGTINNQSWLCTEVGKDPLIIFYFGFLWSGLSIMILLDNWKALELDLKIFKDKKILLVGFFWIFFCQIHLLIWFFSGKIWQT